MAIQSGINRAASDSSQGISVQIGGAQEQITGVSAQVGGVLEPVTSVYVVIDGVQQPVLTGSETRGEALDQLEIGSRLRFGSIHGEPIVWLVADKGHSGYPAGSVTLISERVLKIMAYDAAEVQNYNTDRAQYGSNRFFSSNIRQWLNSNAPSGGWFSAQTGFDQAPTADLVSVNPYDQAPGFLNGFTEREQGMILTTDYTAGAYQQLDYVMSDFIQDKVFLPAREEMGLPYNGLVYEGTVLPLFTEGPGVAYPSAGAVEDSAYKADNLNTDSPWGWWLRTPYANSAYLVYNSNFYDSPNSGYGGLRPMMNLAGSTEVIEATDGVYTILDMASE